MTADLGLLVVGGGPAGLSAAKAYREHEGAGVVRLVSADVHPPYNRPPLSKDYLRGESGPDVLAMEDESFFGDRAIDLQLDRLVVELDPTGKVAVLDDGERLTYSACVLATGSSPVRPPVDGVDHPDVLLLRSRTHAERLRTRAEGAETAVVVGSGFIGCEAAVSLALRGLQVTMATDEARPQEARLGPDVARRIAGWLDEAGVHLMPGQPLESVSEGHVVTLQGGATLTADLVLVAAGIAPHAELAEAAGLDTRESRIVVDEGMRTSAASLYAAGDVVLARNATAGRRLSVEHWGEAMRMGEVAGTNAAGGEDAWAQAPGFWSEIGDHTLKYAAWGDGWDEIRFVEHGRGAFTAWYGSNGVTVGVLTHEADKDYERGQEMVEKGSPLPGTE